MLCRGLLLEWLEDRLAVIWWNQRRMDSESGGELEVGRDAVRARIYTDAVL